MYKHVHMSSTHMTITNDQKVSGLRDGDLHTLINSWPGNATLPEEVKLRHAHRFLPVHIRWHGFTGEREGGGEMIANSSSISGVVTILGLR